MEKGEETRKTFNYDPCNEDPAIWGWCCEYYRGLNNYQKVLGRHYDQSLPGITILRNPILIRDSIGISATVEYIKNVYRNP